MRFLISLGLVGLLVFGAISPASAAPREMTNEELDGVTAGGLETSVLDGLLQFQFGGHSGGVTIDGSGTISLTGSSLPGNVGGIFIGQQNDNRAFVAIAAVNSAVQVLVNMNVNVNSANILVNQANLGQLNKFFSLTGRGF